VLTQHLTRLTALCRRKVLDLGFLAMSRDARLYRELAVQAAAIAARANADHAKVQLLGISRAWETLAIEAEQTETDLSVEADETQSPALEGLAPKIA
jgi:hypothetical protein